MGYLERLSATVKRQLPAWEHLRRLSLASTLNKAPPYWQVVFLLPRSLTQALPPPPLLHPNNLLIVKFTTCISFKFIAAVLIARFLTDIVAFRALVCDLIFYRPNKVD